MKPVFLFLVLVLASAAVGDAGKIEARDKFLACLDAHFSIWDADHDAVLSTSEINARMADENLRGETAAVVATLKRASRYTKVPLPLFSQASLHELAERKPEKNWPNMGGMFSEGGKRIAAAKRSLFVSEKPRIETIHQGRMGNCYCLAPLGAMAVGRPDYIVREMIRPLEDGRFEVRFGSKKMIVSAPTDAEIALMATTESDGLWVNIYEKATGELRNEMKSEAEREPTGLDSLNKGGSAGTQLALITGHEIERLSCKFANDDTVTAFRQEEKLQEIRLSLKDAIKEGRLVTCGTAETKVPGLTPNHAYAVLGFDSDRDVIKLWNPHGNSTAPKGEAGPEHGYPSKDGQFEMPLTVFVKEFAGLAFEVLPNLQKPNKSAKAPLGL